MSSKRKLTINMLVSLLYQIIALICGFILPKQILLYYGSDVNGIISSITRFLSIITFLELGVGPVIQSNLYAPLEKRDYSQISRIVVSAERFYRKIAYGLVAYIVVLSVLYPTINAEFDAFFTVPLLIAISIGSFFQYYFGMTYQLLLGADQKVYIPTALQIITILINTITSIVLIRNGCSIQIVKMASALVYIIRPIVLNIYVKQKYSLNRHIAITEEPIKQKWYGFAQHLASVVCGEADIVLLTIFASYLEVSIYSTYYLVIGGITNLVLITVSGLEPYWGNLMAKGESDELKRSFERTECIIHLIITILFSATAFLITPFVLVYVNGISDSSSYNVPLFGAILTIAYGCQCLRIPYFKIIKAAGHYKQTQNGSYISMSINIVISVAAVTKFGLVGVAVGTFAAMLFHTAYLAYYISTKIIIRKYTYFVYHVLVDVIVFAICSIVMCTFTSKITSYTEWMLYAVKITAIVIIVGVAANIPYIRKYLIHKK